VRNQLGIAAVLFILSTVSVGWSQTVTVGLYSDPQGTTCDLNLATGTIVELFVVITSSEPACVTGVDFAVPIPVCAEGKLLWLADMDTPPVTLGDSPHGIAMGFGTKLLTPITAMRIVYLVADDNLDLCDLQVLPSPYESSGEVLIADCEFNAISAQGHGVGLEYCVAQMPAPTKLSPVNGATDVSLNPTLQWESWMPDVCGESVLGCYPTHAVFFGTAPDPPKVLYDEGGFSWQPGPLQPSTTYYWRVVHFTWMGSQPGSSPEMSFTTVGPVETQNSNWGSIKDLFRGDDD
jgi:hypothetical protein